jgi:hypothetical protein
MRRFSYVRAARSAALALVVASSSFAGACGPQFDTTRKASPAKLTLGDDIFSTLCDRVAATADPSDLEGRRSHDVCHANEAGTYADAYDAADGAMPPKVAVMVRYRPDLIAAFNATIPDDGTLHADLNDLMQSLLPLYDDDTLPESTRTMAAIFDQIAFANDKTDVVKAKRATEVRDALARLGGRRGYRAADLAIGVARPLLSYDRITQVTDTTISLLGPGGAAEPELRKVLEVAQDMLLSTTIPNARTPIPTYADRWANKLGQKPKLTSEILRNLLVDPAPMKGDLSGPAYPTTWIDPYAGDGNGGTAPVLPVLLRDARGYAAFATAPAGVVDTDGDGLPDVNTQGQFIGSNSAPLPLATPFALKAYGSTPADTAPRDAQGRALVAAGGAPLYKYADASKTFLHAVLIDANPLADPKNGALLDLMHAAVLQLGPRTAADPTDRTLGKDVATWTDDTGKQIKVGYRKYDADQSPIVDLLYAGTRFLEYPKSGDYLELSRQLLRDHPKETARLIAAIMKVRDLANQAQYDGVTLDPKSGFWDDMIAIVQQIAQEPVLLKGVINAMADDNVLKLAASMSSFSANLDRLDYDPSDINKPVMNTTTGVSQGPPKTPVDLTKSDTDDNRSLLHRFATLIFDSYGVKACNKPNAYMNTGILGIKLGPYNECDVFVIDDVAKFYLGCVAATNGDAKATSSNCVMPITNGLINALGKIGLVDPILEGQSKINGLKQQPTVAALNRMVMWRTPSQMINDLIDPLPTRACPMKPGTMGTRQCASPADQLQNRDKGTIFMGEELESLKGLAPMLKPFTVAYSPDKQDRLDLFIKLIGVMHKHWSPGNADSFGCVTSAPDGDANECKKSNVRNYEKLISAAIAGDVLPALNQLTKVTNTMTVHGQSGTDVMVAMVSDLVDPGKAKGMGLTDRRGNVGTTTNDGKPIAQTTPFYLFANALNAMDAQWVGTDAAARHKLWRSARGKLVDQFMAVDQPGGDPTKSEFHDKAFAASLPIVIDLVDDRIAEHKASGDFSSWARGGLAKTLSENMQTPIFASVLDVTEKIYANDSARTELGYLIQYLANQASSHDALATTVTAAQDLLQVVGDDKNMVPIYHAIGVAAAPDGATKRALDLMDRVRKVETDPTFSKFAATHDGRRVLPKIMANAMTPMGPGKPAPIEVLMDCIADLHRVDPSSTEPFFQAGDSGSVSWNIEDFLLDPTRGLEQLYAIVKKRNDL